MVGVLELCRWEIGMVGARTARNRHLVFLARWPSHKATRHARDRLRFLTARARIAAPTDQVVAEVNRLLRGWAGYFRFGSFARDLDRIPLCQARVRHVTDL
jgi:RNA-directed DNA polymerase